MSPVLKMSSEQCDLCLLYYIFKSLDHSLSFEVSRNLFPFFIDILFMFLNTLLLKCLLHLCIRFADGLFQVVLQYIQNSLPDFMARWDAQANDGVSMMPKEVRKNMQMQV